MLYGFIGAIYWLVEDEAGLPLVGIFIAKATFWVLTTAVAAVVVVFLVVQAGPGEMRSIWLINEGREYIEAPAGRTPASSSAWARSSTTSPPPS